MPRRAAVAAVALALAGAPGRALAHNPLPGLEGFYLGLGHPVSTPAPLMALVALALMLGQARRSIFPVSLAVFAVGLVAGHVPGPLAALSPEAMADGLRLADFALLAVAVTSGALAAVVPGGLMVPGIVLAGIGGLMVGFVSAPDPGPLGATLITASGSSVGAFLLFMVVAGAVVWARETYDQLWMRVGLRVFAAWATAIATMLLALAGVSNGAGT